MCRLLGDVFRAVDTVVAMYYNRGEVIPLPRLEQGVRDMTKRPWRQDFLQQIRCLFPEAFIFSWRQEKWGRGQERTYCVCEQVIDGMGWDGLFHISATNIAFPLLGLVSPSYG